MSKDRISMDKLSKGQTVERTKCRTDNVSKGQKVGEREREREKSCMTSNSLTIIIHLAD